MLWLLQADPGLRAEIATRLKAKWLYTGFARDVLAAITEVAQPGKPVDIIAVASWLQNREQPRRVSVTELVPDADELDGFDPEMAVRHLRELGLQRKLREIAQLIAVDTAPATSVAMRAQAELAAIAQTDGAAFERLDAATVEAIKRMDTHASQRFVPTGLNKLDRKISGLPRRQVTVMGARTGMGKSSFGLRIARGAAEAGYPAAFLSCEMDNERLSFRLAADVASVENTQIQRGELNEQEFTAISRAFGQLSKLPLYLRDVPATWPEHQAALVALKSQEPKLALVVVDYVGLLRGIPGPRERHLQIATVTGDLVRLSKSLDVAMLAIAQLNRRTDQGQDHRPTLADLRESGSLEQDADLVILLYREDYYDRDSSEKGTLEAIVAKNRDGRTGKVKLHWDARYTRIADLEETHGLF